MQGGCTSVIDGNDGNGENDGNINSYLLLFQSFPMFPPFPPITPAGDGGTCLINGNDENGDFLVATISSAYHACSFYI